MRKKLPILEIVVPCVLDLETFIPEGGEIIHVGIDATGIDALIICAPPHYRQMQGEVSFAATHSEDANDFLYLRHDHLPIATPNCPQLKNPYLAKKIKNLRTHTPHPH